MEMISEAKKSSWVELMGTLIMVIAPVLILSGCGGSSNSSSSSGSTVSGSGSVSGTITDSDGAPVAGATVVAGNSSPTAVTDQDGKFTISNVPSGSVTVNTVTPGYQTNTFTVDVTNNSTTTVAAPIELPDIDDVANAPQITNVTLTATSSTVSVTATIVAGGSADNVIDARAEWVGYGVGSKMTASGSTYSTNIAIPNTFVGPSALIEIFAIDAKRRVGTNAATAAIPGAAGSGGFDASTFTGNWAGGAEFHRAAFGDGDGVGDKRISNVSLLITGSTVSGQFADITIEKHILPSLWAVTKTAFTGTLTLIDASLGIYEMTSTFSPTAT